MEHFSLLNIFIIAAIFCCAKIKAHEEEAKEGEVTIEVTEGTVSSQGTNKQWANAIRADPENPNPYFSAATISIDGLEGLMNQYFGLKKEEGDEIAEAGVATQVHAGIRQEKMEERQYDIMHGEFKMAENLLNKFLTVEDGKRSTKYGDVDDEGSGHPPAEEDTEHSGTETSTGRTPADGDEAAASSAGKNVAEKKVGASGADGVTMDPNE